MEAEEVILLRWRGRSLVDLFIMRSVRRLAHAVVIAEPWLKPSQPITHGVTLRVLESS